MDYTILLVPLTITAILGLAFMSGDENNLMNYYVCDECGDIRMYTNKKKPIACVLCGEACRKIKNW